MRALAKERKVFNQVEKLGGLACAANHRLKTDDALFAFIVNPLPFNEMIEACGQTADQAFASVREDDEGVVPEELRNRVLVIAQVVVERVLRPELFQFDEDERQAVYKAHKVSAAPIHVTSDPELRGEEEIVLLRMLPINYLHPHDLFILPSPPGRGVGGAGGALHLDPIP